MSMNHVESYCGFMYSSSSFEDYVPEDVFSSMTDVPDDAERVEGIFVRLTMPGYMDCTSWLGPFSNKDEAIEALCGEFDVERSELTGI